VEEQWKECVAKDHWPEILRANHDEAIAGHLRIAKTITRVAQHYYWLEMFREITRYVWACKICLWHKIAQARLVGTLHVTAVRRPWEHITLGPGKAVTKKGHTWLLNIQDRFMKWVEIRPLRHVTAPVVTITITEAVILRHGCPDVVLSHNGTQLKSKQLERRLAAYNIRHEFAPIYVPYYNHRNNTHKVRKPPKKMTCP